jgi:transposase
MFMDESGFSLRPNVRRTWARRGETPVLTHRFNWKRLNAIGAIFCTPEGKGANLFLHFQTETVKEDSILWFLDILKRALKEMGHPLVLLWDGLPAHRSRKVKEFIEDEKGWLTVHRFPAYAPELNPVEYLWSPIKTKHTANLCPDAIHELKEHLTNARAELRKDEDFLTGCLHASKLYSKEAESC